MSKNFYATTPIYYVNDKPHIGHAYSTVLTDVLTRFHRLFGFDASFMTGVDEHGQKVQKAAAAKGVSPQAHVDEYNLHFKNLWAKLNVEYIHFIRTTDGYHKDFVRDVLQKLYDKGEIYSKEYSGWYSVGEERFFEESELVDGKDPISHRTVEWLQEKNYFFKMSKYQQTLIDYINANPSFIMPDFRKNEVLGFLKQPLNDLCISRPKSRLAWGIPLPFDEDFVTYVWVDALVNYISGVQNFKHKDGSAFWPADFHIIGKDILTTHSVYWTTILFALGWQQPKHILAHGWWLIDGSKMSKTSGTGINPMDYVDNYGVDVFRYFLIREMVVGLDATFSHDSFVRRINSDLANDLGNGLNRIHKLILSNFDGKIPAVAGGISGSSWGEQEKELEGYSAKAIEFARANIGEVKLSLVVEEVLNSVKALNRYLEATVPWKLSKGGEAEHEKLAVVLYAGAEVLRIALALLSPIMPQKCEVGRLMLGAPIIDENSLRFGVLQGGETLGKGEALFPRIVEKTEE
ncbi:methionine--tRNA ligase [Fibrobacterales bacterium]|nr:methionine--tRNA ligase [Fibrobacterales bacterium]